MALVILDPDDQRRIIGRRRRLGLDTFDEVWNGDYVMSPIADDFHQDLATGISSILRLAAGLPKGTKVRAGVNVSDRAEGWKQNYRCPDVVVFLPDTKAINHGTFWLGGPDFAVEIRSRGDRTRKKPPFYASVGTRELLIVDRNPWQIELYRLEKGKLTSVEKSTIQATDALASEVLPISFRLVNGEERPAVALIDAKGRKWVV